MITGIRHKFLLWVGSVFFALFANTVMADPESAITTVFEELAKHSQSDVHYRDEKHIQLLDQTMIETGILRYRKPDTLIREQHTPEQQRFEIIKNSLSIINDGSTRTIPLDKAPALRAMAESFRATLSGDLPRLRKYYDLKFSGTFDRWNLILRPRDSDVMNYISTISITGGKEKIKRYEIHETEGDWSMMTLTPIDTGK